MKLSSHDFQVCEQAMRCIRQRLKDKEHLFWEELMGSLLTAHILDLYDIHARSQNTMQVSERITVLLRNFIELLYNGEYIRKSRSRFLCIPALHNTSLSVGDM